VRCRRWPLLAVVALLSSGTFLTPARSEEVPSRGYLLHVPTGTPAGSPLVVFLHGCNQTAEEAAAASGFSDLADRLGFVVVYPRQNVTAPLSAPVADGNGIGCWNWFLPDHQGRDRGEPAAIAAITERVIVSQEIDRNRVYVAGVSAGADMAVIMAATYPDVFAAAAVLAACPYATCGDLTGRLAYDAMPADSKRVVPMFVAQGTADHLNPFALGESLVQAWLGTSDWADNGDFDGSVPRTPSSAKDHRFDQSPEPGSGDACIRNENWPCPGGVVGFQKSYPYTVEHYDDATGCNILDFWIIHGMGHAQPKAKEGPFTDPLGPDVTEPMYEFFLNHSLEGACRSR